MNPLFTGLSSDEIHLYLQTVGAKTVVHKKNNFVFFEGDMPQYLFVLQSGTVQIEKNSSDGKRVIMNRFETPGSVFGEVYAFLTSIPYDYACRTLSEVELLYLPVRSFSHTDSTGNEAASIRSGVSHLYAPQKLMPSITIKVLHNLVHILAHKAYFLNRKLLIFSAFSLRQKIAVYLLQQTNGSPTVVLRLNREAMAEYLAVPRPSLSRELMNMQRDGLLTVSKNTITVSTTALEALV